MSINTHPKFISIILFVISFFVYSNNATAALPNDEVSSWKVDAEKTIFPSVILAVNKNIPIVTVHVTPTIPNETVHVSVSVDGLALPSETDKTLGQPGTDYKIVPIIRWDSSKLLALRQPIPTTIAVSTTVNGVTLGTKTISVRVRAVNDVPFLEVDPDGKVNDLSPLFAAFVNENNPVIDNILKEALHWRAVNHFIGYQGSVDDVYMQVFAIWNVLQRHHVKYSSITTPSGTTKDVYSQSVRFIDTTWNMQQANCVDGTVLFASILYKIGIYPVLVNIPGHMFVGFYLSQNRNRVGSNMQFLETTMIGADKQPSKYNWRFGLLHPAKSTYSWRGYVAALQYGNKEYNTKALPALSRHDKGYGIIDIVDARKVGINPISD